MDTKKLLSHLLKSIDQNNKAIISLSELANKMRSSTDDVFWGVFALINEGQLHFSRLVFDNSEWSFIFHVEPVNDIKATNSSDAMQVFNYWKISLMRPRAKLDKKRQKAIAKQLEYFTVEELKQAIDGWIKSQVNGLKSVFQTRDGEVSLILRTAERIENFIAIARSFNDEKGV